jgi:hypothetical protein
MANWFKPKAYGYGATPVTWQGWAIVAGFIAAVLLLAWWLIGFDRSEPPGIFSLLMFLKFVLLLVLAVWLVSKRNTDGEWRWRWGRNSYQGSRK